MKPANRNIYDKLNKQNTWISLFRIFMSFVVITFHFETYGETIPQKIFFFLEKTAAPYFMFLSFYLMSGNLMSLQKEKIKDRLRRLYLPMLFWTLFYFVASVFPHLFLNRRLLSYDIKSLFRGLVFPHRPNLCGPLWFLFDNILILIFIVIVFQFAESKRRRIISLVIITVFAFVLEYTESNIAFFMGSGYEVKYTLGRFIECVPYAATAILYSWCIHKLRFRIKAVIWSVITAITVGVYILISMGIITDDEGFTYSGLPLYLLSVSICMLVLNLPDIFKGKIKLFINWLGSCTMGIYCLHLIVGKNLNNISPDAFFQYTLIFDVIIFVISLILTVVLRFILNKIDPKFAQYVL